MEKTKNEDQEAEMPEKPKKQTMQGEISVAAGVGTVGCSARWKNGIFAPCKTVQPQIVALPSYFR